MDACANLTGHGCGIILASIINGTMTGAVYALVALGLTLIYGVLHIINFAHGTLLMLAMYGVFFLNQIVGVDPYMAMPVILVAAFLFGYGLQRYVIGKTSHGRDEITLLVTLGVSIVIENLALFFFTANERNIRVPYELAGIDLGVTYLLVTQMAAFGAALLITATLWMFMSASDTGRAIRAVAKERQGARLVGINVEHIFALSFGIGTACVGAAAALLAPRFAISPRIGYTFVLIAFTVVVLGGMGSFVGALVGGFIIGIAESVGGLFLGESLGQITISLIFILILLLRPSGLFGEKLR
ncbi:branched-chain amino acid ABC transporter permease [Oceanibacterium hippocampi]|uniref:High-affinity branched-chain amino acid transport system permease protein LivH n=1 Tax=Oceanibacterium hippocampi TaxID=745714 RepID=A0A1Y5TST8_9PROT|nr:branched-chain amino acid ABC transporter permease [Oceanibacterium hippocampi]SLN71492.1 High-affinity branched-chain amino acid transport system permease protein LivH [Oceanibacterium hippocampi]